MLKLGLNEIRKRFLGYFKENKHLVLDSTSLIPQGDSSLLLVNSGMQPLKAYFSGAATPPQNELASCQRCLRNTDIDRVGETARHGTYFEMLGNFSIGSYFKREAIKLAWGFITEVMQVEKEKLHATVYLDDDEAYNIWRDEIGIDEAHLSRLGKKDNFWEIGTGPCGPSSEIYYDWGEQYSCGSPDCKVGCDCDRYVEFWNLVFTQFDKDENGNYNPLAQKNIDTGMGLERLACMSQGVRTLFEVDTINKILQHVCKVAKVEFQKDKTIDRSLLIVTDHVRGAVFLVADGVSPSNEGAGYILRRLLRRAVRNGSLLGIKGDFLHEIAQTVIDQSKEAYPFLEEKAEYIKRIIRAEEEAFNKTIDSGLQILNSYIAECNGEFKGEWAFKLYDTYGFPLDLSIEILSEKGLTLNIDEYNKCLEQQRELSRSFAKQVGWEQGINTKELPATEFVGYSEYSCSAKVLAIFKNGAQSESLNASEIGTIVLDQTPFYAESGGQVGDTGALHTTSGTIEIADTTKTIDGIFLHAATAKDCTIKVGDSVNAAIDYNRRYCIMQNHSAAHLLQKALREVLGNHVTQAGSYVSPEALRFDFTHFAALTPEEQLAVENKVNKAIIDALPIITSEMTMDEAKAKGAMALFNEKYGDKVRMVDMGGYSLELCGGTHLDNTSRVGLFKITAESSIAAGTRRIEAATGLAILHMLRTVQGMVQEVAAELKTTPAELRTRVANMANNARISKQEIEALKQKLALNKLDVITNSSRMVKGITFVSARMDDLDAAALRSLGDSLKEKLQDACILLSSYNNDKISIIAMATKSAVARGVHCGKLISAVAQHTGGGGGGKPDSATAGGKDASKLDEAMAIAADVLIKQINS